MGPSIREILVYRTNVQTTQDAAKVLGKLRSVFHPAERATIDLEDCDKVLRVESLRCTRDDIEAVVSCAGFYCTELEDIVPATVSDTWRL